MLHLEKLSDNEVAQLESLIYDMGILARSKDPQLVPDSTKGMVKTVVNTLQRQYPDTPRNVDDLYRVVEAELESMKGSKEERHEALVNGRVTFGYWKFCSTHSRIPKSPPTAKAPAKDKGAQ